MSNLQPKLFSQSQHLISDKLISQNALKVLYDLKQAGFIAFLVGGCVRDLVLGHQPKDYDVVTSATPEKVRSLFRHSRIVGRRFKIVHVRFGRELIEVSTFRGHHTASDTDKPDSDSAATSRSGLLLRDNVYGTIEEDVWRRDFTVNSLYYDTDSGCVHDYTQGMDDLQQGVLRVVGDPLLRFQEDPVRMLRAIRFAAKLDFCIETTAAKLIGDQAGLLEAVPPARLFDEVLKLFMAGRAEPTLGLLLQYKLFGVLFPATNACLASDPTYTETLLRQALLNTDLRIKAGKPVTPAFLFAALLWPAVRQTMDTLIHKKNKTFSALVMAEDKVIAHQTSRITIPRRFTTMMREIWELHQRLLTHATRQQDQLLAHPRFRAAYDFILLREEVGENLNGMGQWWTDRQANQQPPAPVRKRRSWHRPPAWSAPIMSTNMPVTAYIALGSNLGDSLAILASAIEDIDTATGCKLWKISSWYQNPAIGPPGQPDFINGVIQIETTLPPPELLVLLQKIEASHGRDRSTHWGPRTLDLDILLFGNQCWHTPGLTIPHPHLQERNFVVYPLYELNPELTLPNGQSLQSLLARIPATGLTKISTLQS